MFENRTHLSALIAAICLAAPFTTHAADLSNVGVASNFVVDVIRGQSNHVFDVRNDGKLATGACWMKFSLSCGPVYMMPLLPLAPGEVLHVTVPPVMQLNAVTITLEVDCQHRVTEASESDNIATATYFDGASPWLGQQVAAR